MLCTRVSPYAATDLRLPEDAELRRQLPLHGLFQLVLRFAYANQTFSVLESEAQISTRSCGMFEGQKRKTWE